MDISARSGRGTWVRRVLAVPAVLLLAVGSAAVPAAAAVTAAAGVPLISVNSGRCMNVSGPSVDNNAPIIQWTCSATALNDKWRAVPLGDGTYHLVAVHSGKCANVDHALATDGAAVLQYACSPTSRNDRWRFRTSPDRPTVQLVAEHSGKCLHVQNRSVDNGAALVQWACGAQPGGLNEQWYFPPATSGQPTVLPDTANTPLAVLQNDLNTAGSPVNYVRLDNSGNLLFGRQDSPDDFSRVVWEPVGSGFAGAPALGVQGDGSVQLVGHSTLDGDVWLRNVVSVGTSPLQNWSDVGGGTALHPTVARLTDGSLIVLNLGPGGSLWYLPEDGRNVPYAGWRNLGGPVGGGPVGGGPAGGGPAGSGLVGTPTAVVTRQGLQIFALDATGAVWTAEYLAGRLSDWTSLGGAGFNGTVSAVVLPGFLYRIFVRAADGTIQTKTNRPLGSWEAGWKQVGSFAGAGSPSALAHQGFPGLTYVFARDYDGTIRYSAETHAASGEWQEWANASAAVRSENDPTAVQMRRSSGVSLGFAITAQGGRPTVFLTDERARQGAGAAGVRFTAHEPRLSR